jgi:hypothetical protein
MIGLFTLMDFDKSSNLSYSVWGDGGSARLCCESWLDRAARFPIRRYDSLQAMKPTSTSIGSDGQRMNAWAA